MRVLLAVELHAHAAHEGFEAALAGGVGHHIGRSLVGVHRADGHDGAALGHVRQAELRELGHASAGSPASARPTWAGAGPPGGRRSSWPRRISAHRCGGIWPVPFSRGGNGAGLGQVAGYKNGLAAGFGDEANRFGAIGAVAAQGNDGAPSAPSRTQVARPMPEVPPVTRQILSVKRIEINKNGRPARSFLSGLDAGLQAGDRLWLSGPNCFLERLAKQ